MKQYLPILLFLLFASPVIATTITISNVPSSIDQSQDVGIDVGLVCSGCGDSYLRGVFYPSGINYFGFTQNNFGSWISTTSDKTQYYKVGQSDLSQGNWNGTIQVKPDSSDSVYTGPGNYLFKVGRYTSAGDSSAEWSNEIAVAITGPTNTPTPTITPTSTPTSTPTPTPTKTPTPSPTQAPHSPTNTSTATQAPTKTPMPSPTLTKSSPTPTGTRSTQRDNTDEPFTFATRSGDVLSNTTASGNTASEAGKPKNSLKPYIFSFLFIGIGSALLVFVYYFKKGFPLKKVKTNFD